MLQERSDRAQKVLRLVQKRRSQLVGGMERLCDAYITLAYMDASRHKTQKSERPLVVPAWRRGLSFSHLGLFPGAIPIPADQPIMQIRDLDQVLIPTLELKVDFTSFSSALCTWDV